MEKELAGIDSCNEKALERCRSNPLPPHPLSLSPRARTPLTSSSPSLSPRSPSSLVILRCSFSSCSSLRYVEEALRHPEVSLLSTAVPIKVPHFPVLSYAAAMTCPLASYAKAVTCPLLPYAVARPCPLSSSRVLSLSIHHTARYCPTNLLGHVRY